jgi:hypothetical protein
MFDKIIQKIIVELKKRFPELLPEIGQKVNVDRFVSSKPHPHFSYEMRYFIGDQPPLECSTIGSDPDYSEHAVQVVWNMLHELQPFVAKEKLSSIASTASSVGFLFSIAPLLTSVPKHLSYLDAGGDKLLPHVVDGTSLALAQILLQGLTELLPFVTTDTPELKTLMTVIHLVPGAKELPAEEIKKFINDAIDILKGRINACEKHLKMRARCEESQPYISRLKELEVWREEEIKKLKQMDQELSDAYKRYNGMMRTETETAVYEYLTADNIQQHINEYKSQVADYNKTLAFIAGIDFSVLQDDKQYPDEITYYRYADDKACVEDIPIKKSVKYWMSKLISPEKARGKLKAYCAAIMAKQEELPFVLNLKQAIAEAQKKIKHFTHAQYQIGYTDTVASHIVYDRKALAPDEFSEDQLKEIIALIAEHVILCNTTLIELATQLESKEYKQCSHSAKNYLARQHDEYKLHCSQHIQQLEQIARDYQHQLTIKEKARNLLGLQQLSQAESKIIAEADLRRAGYLAQQKECTEKLTKNEEQCVVFTCGSQTSIRELESDIKSDEGRQQEIDNILIRLNALAEMLIAKSPKPLKEFDVKVLKDVAPDLFETFNQVLTAAFSSKKKWKLLEATQKKISGLTEEDRPVSERLNTEAFNQALTAAFSSKKKRKLLLEPTQKKINGLTEEYKLVSKRLSARRESKNKAENTLIEVLHPLREEQSQLKTQQAELQKLIEKNNTVWQQAREKKAVYDCQIELFELQTAIDADQTQLAQVNADMQDIETQLTRGIINHSERLALLENTLSTLAQKRQDCVNKLNMLSQSINENPKLLQYRVKYETLAQCHHTCGVTSIQYAERLQQIKKKCQEATSVAAAIAVTAVTPVLIALPLSPVTPVIPITPVLIASPLSPVTPSHSVDMKSDEIKARKDLYIKYFGESNVNQLFKMNGEVGKYWRDRSAYFKKLDAVRSGIEFSFGWAGFLSDKTARGNFLQNVLHLEFKKFLENGDSKALMDICKNFAKADQFGSSRRKTGTMKQLLDNIYNDIEKFTQDSTGSINYTTRSFA